MDIDLSVMIIHLLGRYLRIHGKYLNSVFNKR